MSEKSLAFQPLKARLRRTDENTWRTGVKGPFIVSLKKDVFLASQPKRSQPSSPPSSPKAY